MRNILLAALLFFTVTSFSQSLPNSFLEKYNATKTDSGKGKCIRSYIAGSGYMDSTLRSKVLMLLAWFKQHNDPVGEDYTNIYNIRSLNVTGDFVDGLNKSLQLLANFEKRNDEFGQMLATLSIANALDRSREFENAIGYYRRTLALASRNDQQTLFRVMNDLSSTYAQANLPDSGIIYAQQAVNISESLKDSINLSYNLGTLAENYIAKNEFEIAMPFLRKALNYAKTTNQAWPLTYNTNDMSQLFQDLKQNDSAILYARLGVKYAIEYNFKDQLLRSYSYLNTLFEETKITDSANKYFRLTMLTKDSLYNIEKNTMIQTMTFNEKLKQQDAEIEKQKIALAREHNLQYVSIAIGMIIFLITFLLLSRTVLVRTNFIKFFAILGLLAVFEFINLYIHPYLSQWTNDSPIWMLTVLIAIGALLIPIHHKLETTITRVMVEKNKRIRLAAAKKTIQKLEGEK